MTPCHEEMEQDPSAKAPAQVGAAGAKEWAVAADEWAARLPQDRAETVSARSAARRHRTGAVCHAPK